MKIDLQKYDRVIWRLNGTLLLIAVIVGLIGTIAFTVTISRRISDESKGHDLVQVDQNTKKEEFLRLGYFEQLKGSPYILVPLSDESKTPGIGSFKSYDRSARNYLLFDTATKKSFWASASNSASFLDVTRIFSSQNSEEPNAKVVGLAFEVSEKDSNSDGEIDAKDKKVVQYLDLNSKKSKRLIEEVDRLIGVRQSSQHELLVFYSKAGKSYASTFDLRTQEAVSESQIETPR